MDEFVTEYKTITEQESLIELKRNMDYQKYSSAKSNTSEKKDPILLELYELLNISSNTNSFDVLLESADKISRYRTIDALESDHHLLQKTVEVYHRYIFEKHALNHTNRIFETNINENVEDKTQLKKIFDNIIEYFKIDKLLKE